MLMCSRTAVQWGVLSRILTWPSRHRSRLGMLPWTCTFAYDHEPSPILFSCDIRRLDIAVRKNWESHIDASHSRQPLVKGERLVRYEVNAVIQAHAQDHMHQAVESTCVHHSRMCMVHVLHQVIHRLLITTGCCRGHDSVTEWLR